MDFNLVMIGSLSTRQPKKKAPGGLFRNAIDLDDRFGTVRLGICCQVELLVATTPQGMR